MTTPSPEDKALQREAEQAGYALRSSYYYRMYGLWDGLLELLDSVSNPDWDSRAEWGISERAFNRFITPLLPRPRLYRERPANFPYSVPLGQCAQQRQRHFSG